MESIPPQLNVSDEFGYWFSGLFDGEGCLVVYKDGGVILKVVLRDDDESVIEYIKNQLGCGRIIPGDYTSRKYRDFRVAKIADLAEIVVQLSTPDEMRGRVTAVNVVFIGASNEVGQFESGITTQWFGMVPAVVLGGLGTIAIVALWAWRFPALRRVDALVRQERA
jgi:hypothetical protein